MENTTKRWACILLGKATAAQVMTQKIMVTPTRHGLELAPKTTAKQVIDAGGKVKFCLVV